MNRPTFAIVLVLLVGGVPLAVSADATDKADRPDRTRARDSGAELDPVVRGRRFAAAVGGGCTAGSPLSWFAAPRSLPLCGDFDFPGLDGTHVDVNRDGEAENFSFSSASFTVGGPSIELVRLRTFTIEADEVRAVDRVLVRSGDVDDWVQAASGWTGAYVTDAHWNDLDRDGDLDLVLVFLGGDWQTAAAWLENVGYEATRPLTGDLDLDGKVDSADLAMLLGAWNP